MTPVSAMTAFRSLAQYDPEILSRTTRKILKRLKDPVVPEAALGLAVDLVKVLHRQPEKVMLILTYLRVVSCPSTKFYL